MARVLLINPSYQGSYGSAKASLINPILPTLGLATIAATAKARGHAIEILDLSWKTYDFHEVRARIEAFRPDVVGVTATTPLMNQLRDISVLVKDLSPSILVVGGGAHPSALPEATLQESLADAVLVGEADWSFADLCDGQPLRDIPGLFWREDGQIRATPRRTPIGNLDDLPFPAWELFDPRVYRRHMSRLLCRHPPATMAEFSRGCVFKCDFCASKITMALGYRKKSPARCAAEVRQMWECGFREFLLADDIFTSDQKWAAEVCDAIAASGVKMAWSCTNGIRVESAEPQLFEKLRRAGCYRVSFGFESGDDQVLRSFGKGGKATIEQGRRAVQLARRAGLDTCGYFLLGLSSDTEASMRATIEYARELPLDMLKFGITIALPGSPMFHAYAQAGLIRSYEWDDYHIYTEKPLFAHPRLSSEAVLAALRVAYRRAVLTNPAFIVRRLRRGVRTGEFFWDLVYFVKFALLPPTNRAPQATYYARDRWPTFDYSKHLPQPPVVQVVTKSATPPPAPVLVPGPA